MGTKISAFPSMTALQGTELILGDQSGATGTTTPTAVAAYLAGLTTTPVLASYARTAAEIAAGVTPTNYAYAPGDILRYGADPTGSTDSYPAINAAISAWQNGGVGPIFRQVGTYQLGTALTLPNGLVIDLNRSTLKPSGSAGAVILSNTSGVRNGYINLTSTTGVGIYGSQVQDTLCEVLNITCSSGAGIQLVNCYEMHWREIRLDGGSGYAVYVYSNIAGTPSNGMLWDRLSTSGFTTTGDVVLFSGVTGITLLAPDFENNDSSSGSNDLHITATADASTAQFNILGGYIEHNASETGNAILIDGSGGGGCDGVVIDGTFFQTSKQPINVGAGVTDALTVTHCTFQSVTGSPTYAVAVPAGFYPNVHSNVGSQSDIDRTWNPTLLFGGANTSQTGTYYGLWQRVGNQMSVQFQISLTALGTATGDAEIGGLPKEPYAQALETHCGIGYWANTSGLTGAPFGRAYGGNATIPLYDDDAGTMTALTNSNFTATSVIHGSVSYEI